MTQMKRYTGYVNIVSRKINLYNYYTHKLIIMSLVPASPMAISRYTGGGRVYLPYSTIWKAGTKIAKFGQRRYRSWQNNRAYQKRVSSNRFRKARNPRERKTARFRASRYSTYIPRGIRETKQEVQEIHRFQRDIDDTWVNHVTHPFTELSSAPQLVPNRPNTGDNHYVGFDVTRHLFNTDGIMNNTDCSIDVKGIKFTIELENPDLSNEIYVRTLLLRNKNPQRMTPAANELEDELFQDPHDKCKRLDFDVQLATSGENSYDENAKMKMSINRVRRAVYHDKVIKIGHNMNVNSDGTGEVVTNIAPRRGYQSNNQRKIVIRWFPKGGFRFKVGMDGESRKTHMDQIIHFMMFAEKKGFLSETKSYTPEELNYKVKTQIWYKKVY